MMFFREHSIWLLLMSNFFYHYLIFFHFFILFYFIHFIILSEELSKDTINCRSLNFIFFYSSINLTFSTFITIIRTDLTLHGNQYRLKLIYILIGFSFLTSKAESMLLKKVWMHRWPFLATFFKTSKKPVRRSLCSKDCISTRITSWRKKSSKSRNLSKPCTLGDRVDRVMHIRW